MDLEKPKYIDSHCHLNFATYQDDLDDVVDRCYETQTAVINVGTQKDTSRRAVEIAEEYDHMYAIVGLHPIHVTEHYHDSDELGEEGDEFTSRGEEFDPEYYRKLATSSDKVVGIGECGLDYYRNDYDTKSAQVEAFRAQIELALELDLPLMLHIRPSEDSFDAYYDVLDILLEYKENYPQLSGQAHFFAGDTEIAQNFIDLGFEISFTGVITFAKSYHEVIKNIPLVHILSETDSPYVTPVPHRGQRNEPSYVQEVVKTIAEIKNLDEEVVAKQIMQNAHRLYKLDIDALEN